MLLGSGQCSHLAKQLGSFLKSRLYAFPKVRHLCSFMLTQQSTKTWVRNSVVALTKGHNRQTLERKEVSNCPKDADRHVVPPLRSPRGSGEAQRPAR